MSMGTRTLSPIHTTHILRSAAGSQLPFVIIPPLLNSNLLLAPLFADPEQLNDERLMHQWRTVSVTRLPLHPWERLRYQKRPGEGGQEVQFSDGPMTRHTRLYRELSFAVQEEGGEIKTHCSHVSLNLPTPQPRRVRLRHWRRQHTRAVIEHNPLPRRLLISLPTVVEFPPRHRVAHLRPGTARSSCPSRLPRTVRCTLSGRRRSNSGRRSAVLATRRRPYPWLAAAVCTLCAVCTVPIMLQQMRTERRATNNERVYSRHCVVLAESRDRETTVFVRPFVLCNKTAALLALSSHGTGRRRHPWVRGGGASGLH